jgi:hypothetical protein
MVPVPDKHCVAVVDLQRHILRGSRIIKILKSETFSMIHPVIVKLIQVNLLGRVVDIVLVGRIA